MTKIKLKTKSFIDFLKLFEDVRNIGLVIFAIIVLLVTWSGVRIIWLNYGLQKQIAVLEQKNELKKLENSNARLKNRYLESDKFIELSARKRLNKAQPGESMVIIPKTVAMKYGGDSTGSSNEANDENTLENSLYKSLNPIDKGFNKLLDKINKK